MKKSFFIFILLLIFSNSNLIYAAKSRCPDKILGTDTVQGIYQGNECGDMCYSTIKLDTGENFTFIQGEDDSRIFGDVGNRVEVTVNIEQFWNEYGQQCDRTEVFKSGKIIKKAENNKELYYSKLINDVFDHQNINTTIQYFDKKYGPAKIDNGDYREYDIDGCNITVKGDKNVESISLKLNPQCNVDMSKFLNNGTSAYGMTFGDFERNSILMDYVANCFAGSCGNMLDASVDAYGLLSHAHNFLELKASVTINTEASVDASLRVTSEIRELNEYDFLIEHTAFCTEKDSKIIKNHFNNIKIDTITIGYNLKEKCDENDNIQSNSYDSMIDIVKNGKLKLDTSTTISGAFSGYKYFNHTKDNWTSFKDEQGRTVVEYKTEYVFREDIKLGLKEYGKKADLLTAAGYRGFDEINFVNWARTKADSVKPEFHVQFYVSDDGNFQVNFVGIIDPKTYSFVSGMQMIYAVYENQPLNIAFDFYKELKKKMR